MVSLRYRLFHWNDVSELKCLLWAGTMIIVPLGLKRCVIDFVGPKQRKREAQGMEGARFLDLQDGLCRTILQLPDHAKLALGKVIHRPAVYHASNLLKRTSSVRISRDKHCGE